MRSFKILGLTLVAVFVTSVALASTAAADDFTAESYPVTVTGSLKPATDIVLGTTAGNTTCTTAQEHGTLSQPSTTLTMTAVFGGCTGPGMPGVWHMNGCDFLYHVEKGDSTLGTMDIVCPAGQEITKTSIIAGTTRCTLHIPPQVGLGPLLYTNVGEGATREITVDVNINNLKYTHTKGTGLGSCTTGSGTTGTFTAKTTWTGEVHGGGAHRGIFLSNA